MEVRSPKWVGRAEFLLEVWGRIDFLAFSSSWKLLTSLAGGSSSLWPSFHHHIFFSLTLLPASYKYPYDYIGPTQKIQYNLPY